MRPSTEGVNSSARDSAAKRTTCSLNFAPVLLVEVFLIFSLSIPPSILFPLPVSSSPAFLTSRLTVPFLFLVSLSTTTTTTLPPPPPPSPPSRRQLALIPSMGTPGRGRSGKERLSPPYALPFLDTSPGLTPPPSS
ncbi:hypothetical protein E2C01_003795 [Portunus trituberculatus]|uniref:Uncharacterized protein n=1 Tax=Portunus trituberculatus TaxID=210409 RepID=A0A5B7CN94_PORTR|nr:hypothetical protein [Portunus trituberculatus]